MIPPRALRDLGERLDHVIEGQQWLDRPSYKLEHLLALSFNLLGAGSKPAQDALHGTWLGHPLHPVLTDVPIGAWTTALFLDCADVVRPGQDGVRRAARLAVGAGTVGGVGAALAGVTDWQYTHDNARRTGLVHGTMNGVALALYGWSWADRRRGRTGRGRVASTVGYGVVLASAYLGGTLVFRHRIGVDHSDDQLEPRDFVRVCSADELVDDVPHPVEYRGGAAVLVRHGGSVRALGAHCSHLGAPMGEGWVQRDELICPWHGSRFDLASGQDVRGPATAPLPCFETRIRDGAVEIRRMPVVSSAVPGRTLAAGGAR